MSQGPIWVKYSPSDYLDGVEFLTLEEELVYWRICTLIYKTGGPVRLGHPQMERFTKVGKRWTALRAKLVKKGKIVVLKNGALTNSRCERELQETESYISNKSRAGKASAATGKSLKNLKPFQNRAQNRGTEQPQNQRSNQAKVDYINNNLLGRCAPPRASARSGDAGEHARATPTTEEVAEVDALVQEATAVLTGKLPKRNGHLADPVAYDAAVKNTKRNTWLNELAAWVGPHLEGNARLEAWEAIEQSRAAGSRKATPLRIRQLLDRLDELQRKVAE